MSGQLPVWARISGWNVKVADDALCLPGENSPRDSKLTSPNTKMNNTTPRKPHVVFYFSDTGGGHRSAAEAVIEAIHIEYRNMVTTEMVDFFKDYAPRPFNHAAQMYPYMVRAPQLWSAGFHATDGRARARVITTTMWPIARQAARSLVRSHPADLIVTVHPFANSFALRALGNNRPPFINVVTDMVRSEEHTSELQSRLHLVCRPPRSTLFPYTTLFRSCYRWTRSCPCHHHDHVAHCTSGGAFAGSESSRGSNCYGSSFCKFICTTRAWQQSPTLYQCCHRYGDHPCPLVRQSRRSHPRSH